MTDTAVVEVVAPSTVDVSVDLLPAPVTVTVGVPASVAVSVGDKAGPIGPTGPTGVVAATAPLTYDPDTQTLDIDGAVFDQAGDAATAQAAAIATAATDATTKAAAAQSAAESYADTQVGTEATARIAADTAQASGLVTETARAEAVEALKANTADLAPVATSGDYGDLDNLPTLGTAAAANTGDFDAAGAAATAQTAAIFSAASDATTKATAAQAAAIAAAATDATTKANNAIASSLQKASNLSDLASAATARTNLGLGTAALSATGDFDAAGAATAVKGLPVGVAGVTFATRFAGATTSGFPTAGTFTAGDWVVDRSGAIWICTTGGTHGTWTALAGTRLGYFPLASTVFAISMSTTPAEITGSPITVSPTLGSRNVEVSTQLVVQPTAAALVLISIKDITAGTIIGAVSQNIPAGSIATLTCSVDYTPPSAGARTFRPLISISTGTTTLNVYGFDVNKAISDIKVTQL